ncbi:MAG: hypothetical protein WD066_13920 [Planctomycetaceae bacterium]
MTKFETNAHTSQTGNPHESPGDAGVVRTFRRLRGICVILVGLVFSALQLFELQQPWWRGPWLRTFEGWLVAYFFWVALGRWKRAARIAVSSTWDGTRPAWSQRDLAQMRISESWRWSPREWRESPSRLVEFLGAVAAVAIAARLPESGGAIILLTAAHVVFVVAVRFIRGGSAPNRTARNG